MTTKRVSNEQLLAALTDLPAAIAAAMQATTVAAPVATNVAPEPTGETNIQVDAQYLNHMVEKVTTWAKDKGEDCILYARENVRGETKLAYCLASKWTGLKDKRMLGAVKHISIAE